MAASAVKAVGAYALLGEADAFYESVYLAELKGGEIKTTGDLVDQAAVFGCAGSLVEVEFCGSIPLEVLYDASCDQLHVAFGGGEVHEFASVDERGAGYACVHLLGTALVEGAHVVAELCTAHYGIVAEYHPASVKDGAVGYQLHLCHQGTALLGAGGEAAWPGGGVFQHGAAIWDLASVGIAEGMADTGVRNAAHAVGLRGVLLPHTATRFLPHCFGVYAEVVAGRKAVVDP